MRALAAVVAAGLGAIGILALRDATLSTHEAVSTESRTELVLRVQSHGEEAGQTLVEMAEAIILGCRLEVHSDLVEPIQELSGGRFRAVLRPSMDTSDRRQFRGCLEDWSIDHARAEVAVLGSLD
jgi:hypothetical protein